MLWELMMPGSVLKIYTYVDMLKMDLKEFAQNITMHGFGRMFITKRKLLQFLWLALILCFTCILGVQLETIITKYFDYPSVTTITTVVQSKMDFPAITICGLGKNETVALNDSVFPKNDDLVLMSNVSESCLFGASGFCVYPRDFKETLTIDRGLCTTFNPNGTKKQLRSGYFYGLTMFIFLNVSKPTSFIGEMSSIGDGIEVFPHKHADFPIPITSSYLASPGFLTRIEMKKSEIHRKRHPYKSNCTDGSNVNLLYPGQYTMMNCQESCFAYEMAKRCPYHEKYRNFYLPSKLKKPAARSMLQSQCFINTYEELDAAGYKSCDCQLPCHETKFASSVSYSKWPSAARLPYYKQIFSSALGLNQSTMTDDYVRQNFAKISVYYADMSYDKISEVASYTWDQLTSDVGGQMGIWIGASVFSIMELIYLSIQSLRFVFAKISNKSNDVQLPPV